MKKTIILASLAIAALFAFSSCQKETLQDNESTNGVRIINAEFENNATKTELNDDGKTPEWAVGDVIRILNATSHQDVTLISGEDTPTNPGDGIIKKGAIVFAIPGTMTGTLYAVYPASATTMTSCTDGNINFTIPAIQDGTFASANICVAKSTEEDENNKDNLIFSNATAVLEIKTAADVVGVDVTAANKIAGNVTASFDGSAVSLTTTALDKNYVSAVGTSAPTGNVFYLAVAPVITGSATANCYKTAMKGTAAKSSKELQRNIIYSMDLSTLTIDNSDLTGQRGILNGHEYVLIKAKYDSSTDSYLKWATKNIGAAAPKESGEYFAWGETSGYKPAGSSFSHTYAWTSYCGQSSFAEWSSLPYDNVTKILSSTYDAAAYTWGSTWRMPKGGDTGEFKALFDATCWKWDDTDKGYYVYAPNPSSDAGKVNSYGTGTYDKSNALLFFPAAGNGYNTSLNDSGNLGNYWSSTRESTDSSIAYSLYLNGSEDSVDAKSYGERFRGYCVRPVSN